MAFGIPPDFNGHRSRPLYVGKDEPRVAKVDPKIGRIDQKRGHKLTPGLYDVKKGASKPEAPFSV